MRIALFFVAALLAGGIADTAEACSCVAQRTGNQRNAVAMAVNASKAVFVGHAVEEQRVAGAATAASWRTRMRVEETLAGSVGTTVDVYVPDDACGSRFTIGDRYLVYAVDQGGEHWTHACTRTGMAQGHGDLGYLRDRSYLQAPTKVDAKRGFIVAHERDSRLAFIDPSAGTITTLGEVASGPHEIAVSRSGTKAVVTSYDPKPPNGSSLSVVDLATFETTRHFIGSLFRPQAIAISDDIAWYTVEAQVALGQFDLQGGPAFDRRPADRTRAPVLVAATREGMVVTTYADSAEIAFNGRDRLTHVAVQGVPQLIELTPDESRLWVVAGSRVTILDVEQKTAVATFDLTIKRPGAMQFLPDGGRVVISDLDSGDVLVVDAQTHELRGRVHVGRTPSDIAVTPNGRQAYVALTGDNTVVGLDLARMAVFQTIPTGDAPTRIVWTGPR